MHYWYINKVLYIFFILFRQKNYDSLAVILRYDYFINIKSMYSTLMAFKDFLYRIIFRKGANPDILNYDGLSALHLAVSGRYEEVSWYSKLCCLSILLLVVSGIYKKEVSWYYKLCCLSSLHLVVSGRCEDLSWYSKLCCLSSPHLVVSGRYEEVS